jgi:hypothetical protein
MVLTLAKPVEDVDAHRRSFDKKTAGKRNESLTNGQIKTHSFGTRIRASVSEPE